MLHNFASGGKSFTGLCLICNVIVLSIFNLRECSKIYPHFLLIMQDFFTFLMSGELYIVVTSMGSLLLQYFYLLKVCIQFDNIYIHLSSSLIFITATNSLEVFPHSECTVMKSNGSNGEIRKRLNENGDEKEVGRRIKALLTGMFS